MNNTTKTTLKFILNLTKHLFSVTILALIPFSSSSQNCDSPSQTWVLISTSANSCDGSIPNQLDLRYSDDSECCESDWRLSQIFDNTNNNIKYVFITPGDYRWLGTLQMRGLGSSTDKKHIVYISDTDMPPNGYDDEINEYITSGELVTPMDDISDPDSVVPDPLTHAIIENMRLYSDDTGAGNYIIKGLSFSGIFGGIEDIVTDQEDYDNDIVEAVQSAGFDLQNANWNNLNSIVYNNVANDTYINNYLDADDCGFTSGLRNWISGTNVTLGKILIENVRRGNALNLRNCHNCVISNSIIRNSYDEFCPLYDEVLDEAFLVTAGNDNIGITVGCSETDCEDISILNNKIYNTSDGIHFIYQASSGDTGSFLNGLVQNNEIYFKSEAYLYLDDENKVQKGIADDELQMIQGEDGIDIKIGGIANSPLVIRENNIFGWRRAFGAGGDGFAINCHIKASYVTIESNFIYDCQNGIGLGNQNAGDPNLNDSFYVTNNVIENLYLGIDHCDFIQISELLEDDPQTDHDDRLKPIGIGISSVVHKGVNISGNCISETIIPLMLEGWTRDGISDGRNMYVTDNICKNNTRPMFMMRSILTQNPNAFSNFTNNTYEYYEDGSSQIFECCDELLSQKYISEYGAATSNNCFIQSEVISSDADSDNLCLMNTAENNMSCFTDCENIDNCLNPFFFTDKYSTTSEIFPYNISVPLVLDCFENGLNLGGVWYPLCGMPPYKDAWFVFEVDQEEYIDLEIIANSPGYNVYMYYLGSNRTPLLNANQRISSVCNKFRSHGIILCDDETNPGFYAVQVSAVDQNTFNSFEILLRNTISKSINDQFTMSTADATTSLWKNEFLNGCGTPGYNDSWQLINVPANLPCINIKYFSEDSNYGIELYENICYRQYGNVYTSECHNNFDQGDIIIINPTQGDYLLRLYSYDSDAANHNVDIEIISSQPCVGSNTIICRNDNVIINTATSYESVYTTGTITTNGIVYIPDQSNLAFSANRIRLNTGFKATIDSDLRIETNPLCN